MPIPLLLTMDLEIAEDHNLQQQADILPRLAQDMERLRLPLTVFTTANAGRYFSDEVNVISKHGHEIGCHGLDHTPQENYAQMPKDKIASNINTATNFLTSLIGSAPRCFRGPFMSTSAATQEALIQHEYLADFSVCPQRIDAICCNGWQKSWLTAPRNTYQPNKNTPFRSGSLPLWVVPMSGIGVPFISGILYLFGPSFAKLMFRCLLLEAKIRGNPIVYLFHSYEFTQPNNSKIDTRPWHQQQYTKNIILRYQQTLSFFQYMLAHKDVVPMTGQQYLRTLQ